MINAVVRLLALYQYGLGSIPFSASYLGWVCWFERFFFPIFLYHQKSRCSRERYFPFNPLALGQISESLLALVSVMYVPVGPNSRGASHSSSLEGPRVPLPVPISWWSCGLVWACGKLESCTWKSTLFRSAANLFISISLSFTKWIGF